MTALATFGVDTNRDPAYARDLRDSFDELPPGHGTIFGRWCPTGQSETGAQIPDVTCGVEALRLRYENRPTSLMSSMIEPSVTLPLHEQRNIAVLIGGGGVAGVYAALGLRTMALACCWSSSTGLSAEPEVRAAGEARRGRRRTAAAHAGAGRGTLRGAGGRPRGRGGAGHQERPDPDRAAGGGGRHRRRRLGGARRLAVSQGRTGRTRRGGR